MMHARLPGALLLPLLLLLGTGMPASRAQVRQALDGPVTVNRPAPAPARVAARATGAQTSAPAHRTEAVATPRTEPSKARPLGTGGATPTITWNTPASINFGTPLSSTELDASATYNGTPLDGSYAYTPAAGTILPIGTTTLTVTFTPADSRLTTATATVPLTVTNSVAILWPTPKPIVYGTPTSSAQQTATSYNNIPGTFTYSPGTGVLLNVGNNQLSVTFTPADTSTYAVSTGSTTLSVYKAKANQPTTTALAVSASQVNVGDALTLTSTTTQEGTPLPGSTVSFYDGTLLLGSAEPAGFVAGAALGPGQASIKAHLGAGTHTLTARFNGTQYSEASTSAPATVTVAGNAQSAVQLAAAANATVSSNFDFTATVSGFGHVAPGGTVTFADLTTGAMLGTQPVANAAAEFNFSMLTAPTPAYAVGIAVGDVNNDGIKDLALVTYDSNFVTLSLQVSLGNGDGTFEPSSTYTIGSNPVNTYGNGVAGDFNGVAIGDLDGDGNPDIVVTDSNNGNIDVLLGKGDGTFKAPVPYGTGGNNDTAPFPNGTFPQGVSLGDMDGDGRLDAVVGNNGPGTVAILLGNGDGTFQAAREYAGSGGNQLALADYAGTGNLGVAVSGGSGAVAVYLGNGDGSLQQPSFVPVGTQTIGVAAADLNADGRVDLAVLDQVGNAVSVALGNGDGTFQAAVPYATSVDPTFVVATDVNADGSPDLVVANYVGTGTHALGGTVSNLSLLIGNGDGTFQPQTIFPVGSTVLAAADLNGDSVIDLADAGQVAVHAVLGGTALTAGLQNVALAGAGPHTIRASYAPAAGSIYTASTKTVVVTNGAGPALSLSWPQPAPIVYGTPLGAAQLDATATANGAPVPGTFVYTPAAGTILPVGTNTLSVTFTPTGTTYAPVTVTVTLTVTQATPVISWATPAQIVAGTALSAAQLDATASVPGTFSYTPTAGAVLPLGAQTLSVTFTPSDTVDYTTATASVTVPVTNGPAAATLSGPATTEPASQPGLTLTLGQPYPLPLTATFALSVAPTAAGGIVDPAILFSNGRTTESVTIPANTTTVPAIQLAAGTVASTITVRVTLTAVGADVTPTSLQPVVIAVPATAPVLSSATLVRNGKVLTVVIQGSSSTRDMTEAAFTFTPAAGRTIKATSLTVPLATDFQTWYQNTASDQFGSGFLYTQVFNLSDDASTVGSLSVTLTNAVGASNAESAQ